MSDPVSKAKPLIDVAADTFVEEILPEVSAEHRYTAAMAANALSIARRRLSQPDPGENLLATLGVATLGELAGKLRAGELTSAPEQGLREHLLGYVEAELAITNPRFRDQRSE